MSLNRKVWEMLLVSALSLTSAHAQSTVRLSIATDGTQGNGESTGFAAPSKTGRYVAFHTLATNFDGAALAGIFLRDRDPDQDQIFDEANATTTRMSVSESGVACYGVGAPAMSGDGRFVVFASSDPNLMTGAPTAVAVYLRDRDPDADGIFDEGTHTLELISVNSSEEAANAGCFDVDVSDDGNYVVFTSSASNLVAGYNNNEHVYRRNRSAGVTELVDANVLGVYPNGPAGLASLSNDGSKVAFTSNATDLTASDSNGFWADVFLREMPSATTTLVGVNATGEQPLLGASFGHISGNGLHVAFETRTLPGDVSNYEQIYVRDVVAPGTAKISVPNSGGATDDDSLWPNINDDGRFVTFTTYAENLVDEDVTAYVEAIVHDRDGDGNGLYDEGDGKNKLLAVSTTGAQANAGSLNPVPSGDGRHVVFYSSASNLVPGDTNGTYDLFGRDHCPASFASYGDGWPGTLGIPTLTASGNPTLGASLSLVIGNSLGATTPGVVFLGFAPATTPTIFAGTLLVAATTILPLLIPGAGVSIPVSVPDDDALCGLSVYLQVLESDAGASKGVSFTRGLRLQLGE